MRLGCLFVLVPLVELSLLIWLGQRVGLWPTLALVATTGILGAALARREGIRALVAVQSELATGRMPGRTLMDGAAVLVGGAFLLTPGVLTDVAGFLLLLPPTRRLIFRWVTRRVENAIRKGTLRMSIWTDAGSHGPDAGFPFGFGAAPGSKRSRGGTDSEDDDDRPPRPGEIVQE